MKSRKVLLEILLGGDILSLPMAAYGRSSKKKLKRLLAVQQLLSLEAVRYSDMKRGEPGYSPNLDRDNDRIACESK